MKSNSFHDCDGLRPCCGCKGTHIYCNDGLCSADSKHPFASEICNPTTSEPTIQPTTEKPTSPAPTENHERNNIKLQIFKCSYKNFFGFSRRN